MSQCYGAVPFWIMPTWRVAEQLPAEIGVIDLVIIDGASQSDVTELPVLLRGKKVLVVGDDRQVSPTGWTHRREHQQPDPHTNVLLGAEINQRLSSGSRSSGP